MLLAAEALFTQSGPMAAWVVLFFLGNTIYFRHFEEPRLAARFGDDYQQYCRHVGRWLPRLTPWKP